MRKIFAVGCCGLMLGGIASVFTAAPAQARFSNCDNKIDNMEKQAAKQYKQGKLSAQEYSNIQAEIAYHRDLWGC